MYIINKNKITNLLAETNHWKSENTSICNQNVFRKGQLVILAQKSEYKIQQLLFQIKTVY